MSLKLLEIIPVDKFKECVALRDVHLLQLLEKQDWKCAHCSAIVLEILVYYDTVTKSIQRVPLGINSSGEEVRMTIDHIMPTSKGGTNTFKNKQALCQTCNKKKADKLPTKKKLEKAI